MTSIAQLAPVYKPGGGKPTEAVIPEITPRIQVVSATPSYTTKTVYGFLDFVTTVGNTVMVFTPQSDDKSMKFYFYFH